VLLLAACAYLPQPSERELEPRFRQEPTYPTHLHSRGVEGYVVVRYLVTSTGEPTDIEIVESVPEGVFDPYVLRVVPQWRFRPKRVQGENVSKVMRSLVDFCLDPREPRPGRVIVCTGSEGKAQAIETLAERHPQNLD
jgi:protein TonB